MSKRVLILVISLVSIFLMAFAALAIWWFSYNTHIRIKDVCRYTNPENQYTIVFQAVGSPVSFGATSVKVSLLDDTDKIVESITTTIQDDGAIARKDNLSVTWFDDYAQVTLHGSEQEDAVHIMEFDP